VGEYRKLKDTVVDISDDMDEIFLQDIYGRLGISLFAGPNGSGKTALLSFLAQVFHRLEREPELLP
jgi:type II secretory ATPase GspE/PulE/Tfp pilus assembly ATPase PilB-like protein